MTAPNVANPHTDAAQEPQALTPMGFMSVYDAKDVDSPASRRVEVNAMMGLYEDARTAARGSRAILESVKKYLPKHPKERPADYARRSQYTEFYNAFGRTLRGIAALPFTTKPTLKDVPKRTLQQLEDIDGEGASLDVFAQRLLIEGLTVGAMMYLLDAPQSDGNLTVLQEEEKGIRPYWLMVRAEQICSWRIGRVNGKRRLTQLVIRQEYDKPVGTFQNTVGVRYIAYVYNQDTGQVWTQRFVEESHHGKTTVVEETPPSQVHNTDRIPFFIRTLGIETSDMTAITPLIDLLDLNLGHFRVSSDRRWLMHLSCVPVPVETGGTMLNTGKKKDDDAVDQPRRNETYGPNVLKKLPAGGDFKYVEPTGTAFGPTGEEIREIEKRMAAVGLSFMANESRGAETATAWQIDAAMQNATLSSCVDMAENLIDEGLSVHAQMNREAVKMPGGKLSGGTWRATRDYTKTVLSPQMLDAYSRMEQAGQLTLETLWGILERYEALPDGFDAKKELRKLAMQAMTVSTPGDGVGDDPTDDPTDDADAVDADEDTADDEGDDPVPPKTAVA